MKIAAVKSEFRSILCRKRVLLIRKTTVAWGTGVQIVRVKYPADFALFSGKLGKAKQLLWFLNKKMFHHLGVSLGFSRVSFEVKPSVGLSLHALGMFFVRRRSRW